MTDEEVLSAIDLHVRWPLVRAGVVSKVLDDFDFSMPVEMLAAKCRAKVGTEQYERLQWLHEMAYRVGWPKALVVETVVEEVNSGSLPQWPIEGQRELFRILGDTEGAVGVRLTESCLMLPSKSVSGILFQDHTGHVNCALCPREKCPNRRVPYRMDTK